MADKPNGKMIYTVAGIFIMIFSVLIGYLIYFNIFKRREMSTNSHNTRMNHLEAEVIRGNIYDTTGTKLLATTDEEGKRVYPYDELYAHAVGYAAKGKTGAEALANSELLYPNYNLVSIFKMGFFNKKFQGRDVVLTIDTDYQEAVQKAMRRKKGSVVVLEASSGRILSMYSSPNFNPNNIKSDWEELNTDETNSPLLNRATKGLYPPGSIFKVVTTLAYMNESPTHDFTYDCTGSIKGEQDGKEYTISCYNHTAHGEVDLEKAFAKSCNSYFIALSRILPYETLKQTAEALGFNKGIETQVGYTAGRFSLQAHSNAFEKDATAIGQGRTLTNPFHMAFLTAAIANDGVAMSPYLVQYSMNQNRQIKDNHKAKEIGPLMDEEQAKQLQHLMEGVLDYGTGVTLPEKGLIVGGKTGTAQNETADDHSWFMGYAKDPKDSTKPTLAFAILVEGGGRGAQSLAVADAILDVYRNK